MNHPVHPDGASRSPRTTDGSPLAAHGSRLVIASSNRGKLAEIHALLGDLPIELVAQGELDIVRCLAIWRTRYVVLRG